MPCLKPLCPFNYARLYIRKCTPDEVLPEQVPSGFRIERREAESGTRIASDDEQDRPVTQVANTVEEHHGIVHPSMIDRALVQALWTRGMIDRWRDLDGSEAAPPRRDRRAPVRGRREAPGGR